MTENGKSAVQHGDKVLCPCGRNRVIADSRVTYHDGETLTTSAPQAADATAIVPFDQQFTLRDHTTQKPLAWVSYVITRPSGETVSGMTDGGGRTQRFQTSCSELLAIKIQH